MVLSVQSLITTIISFGALALSSFKPVHLIGLSIFIGLFTAYISSFFYGRVNGKKERRIRAVRLSFFSGDPLPAAARFAVFDRKKENNGGYVLGGRGGFGSPWGRQSDKKLAREEMKQAMLNHYGSDFPNATKPYNEDIALRIARKAAKRK